MGRRVWAGRRRLTRLARCGMEDFHRVLPRAAGSDRRQQDVGSKMSSAWSNYHRPRGHAAGAGGHVAVRVLAALLWLPAAKGCDWTCEPWTGFDGRTSKVLDATDGAPTSWLLNGSCRVSRDSSNCLDQSLTFEDCEACNEETGPHAFVEIDGKRTTIGGKVVGRAPWQQLIANDSAARGIRRRLYAFDALATAVIDTWAESGVDGASGRVRKRVRVQPTSEARVWTHVHVAVNVGAC